MGWRVRQRMFFITGELVLTMVMVMLPGVVPEAWAGWTSKTSMPTARTWLSVAEVNGTLYAVGGNTMGGTDVTGPSLGTVEAYNPVADSWSAKAPMPTPRDTMGVGVINGKLYAVGGCTRGSGLPQNCPRATLEVYDPVMNTWAPKAAMPTARHGLAVGVVNGILYAVGGCTCLVDFATVEAYDPATNTWTTKAPMPTPRGFLAVAAVDGLLYAIGGVDHVHGLDLATVEVYNPVTNTWSTRSPLPEPAQGMAAGVINGIIYVAGIHGDGLAAYNPVLDSWTLQAPVPTPRSNMGVGVANGLLYAVGGMLGPPFFPGLSTVEAFTPDPILFLRLNQAIFHTGNPLTLTAGVTPGATPSTVDAYLAVRLPDGTLLFYPSFTPALQPVLTNWTVAAFSGEVFRHTFTGGEPLGNYAWLAAFTEPGTLNIIGGIVQAPFSFGP